MRKLWVLLLLSTALLQGAEPIRIPHWRLSKWPQIVDRSGGVPFWYHSKHWSTQGYLIDILPSLGKGNESFRVFDLETLDPMSVLWLYKGVVMRKGEDHEAKKKARDAEFLECWRKRGPQVGILEMWGGYGLAHSRKKYEAWRADPKAPWKEPGYYGAGVGAVSRDLKKCYIWEFDETRMLWPGPNSIWGLNGIYQVMDLETGKRREIPPWLDGIAGNPMDISPDGRWVVADGREGPVVAGAEDFKPYRKFKFPWHNLGSTFCPNSKYMLAYSYRTVRVFDVEGNRVACEVEPSDWNKRWLDPKPEFRIKFVMISADSRYLWIYGGHFGGEMSSQWAQKGRACLVWDIARNKAVRTLTDEQLARVEGFGPIPGTVFLGAKDRLQLVHLTTGTPVAELLLPPGAPPRRYLMCFAPDEQERFPWYNMWDFKTLSRPDGLVVSGMEDRVPDRGDAFEERKGLLHRVPRERKKREGLQAFGSRDVNWHLGPHMEALRMRVADLDAQKR